MTEYKNRLVLLMPMLMMDHNRKDYNKAIDYALEHYDVDLIAINAQEFKESDYRDDPKIAYVLKYDTRQGNSRSRNQLLEWFYNSEYEWAVMMDAGDKITKTTLNDFRTVVDAVKRDIIEVDVITSTFGNNISGIRIAARAAEDHLENIKLVEQTADSESHFFQGLFMRNFNRDYGMKVYIEENLDFDKGVMNDPYFVLLLRRLFEVRQCPTIVFSVPGNNRASTWMTDQTKYPKTQYPTIKKLVAEAPYKPLKRSKSFRKTYILPRVEYMREAVTVYKPRKKKMRGGLL